jgi:hypothetical protein
MQVDILAIQESLATPEATQAWEAITNQLSKQTGDTWRWHRQPCGRPDDHHLGLLWNDSRVALSKFDSLWQFNSKASSARNACTSGLRPGHYAFVQSRQKDGADFHLIAVHLKSGPTVFAVEQRQKAFNRIDKAVAPLLKKDHDVVIREIGNHKSLNSSISGGLSAKKSPAFPTSPSTYNVPIIFEVREGNWIMFWSPMG